MSPQRIMVTISSPRVSPQRWRAGWSLISKVHCSNRGPYWHKHEGSIQALQHFLCCERRLSWTTWAGLVLFFLLYVSLYLLYVFYSWLINIEISWQDVLLMSMRQISFWFHANQTFKSYSHNYCDWKLNLDDDLVPSPLWLYFSLTNRSKNI